MRDRSRSLFGRERELAEADVAIAGAAAGTPQVVLLGGEAGIGKSRLVREIGGRAGDLGFTVVTGHCLDIEAGVPLGPVREALRGPVTSRTDASLPPVTRRLAPYLRTHVTPTDATSGSLMEDLRLVAAELSQEAPLMLVLEDLHWADRSTQDFAVAAARTLGGSLLVVLTYRTDEVTRRHPWRRAVVEIARSDATVRIDLGPLDRPAIAGIVREVAGAAPKAVVGSLLSQSEGNPLFAEELLASDSQDRVPEHLSDLLLARVDPLSAGTRDLLRFASVNDSRIDPALLGEAAHLSATEVDTSLREALNANVVVPTGEHLMFRHGLLRQALYDDLLPDERIRIHGELASTLQARVDADSEAAGIDTWGPLAYHWAAAHALPEAFVASLQAGLAAGLYGGLEAIAHLERALALWARVPEPERLGGIAKAEIFRRLAEAAAARQETDRGEPYLRAALDLLDTDIDPLVASRVYSTYARSLFELSDRISHREALELAVANAGVQPCEELAVALLETGRWHARRDDHESAIQFAGRSVDVAVAAGCRRVEARASIEGGIWLEMLGRNREGMAWQRSAIEVAEAAGLLDVALMAQATLAFNMMLIGDWTAGLALAESGRLRADAAGLPIVAAYNGEQAVEAMRNAGAFDDADALLGGLQHAGMPAFRWRWMRVEQLMARGDLEAALPLERESMAWLQPLSGGRLDASHVTRQVNLFSALGDATTALRIADATLGVTTGDSRLDLAQVTRAVYVALAAAATSRDVPPEGMRERADDALRRSLDWMTEQWSDTLHAAAALEAAAIARTLDGEPGLDEWRVADAAAARHGEHYVLGPRLGLVAALCAAGERTEARAVLTQTWLSARDMGARWIEQRAVLIARRNRIALPGDEHLPKGLTALTAREREVLDVLATGATNRAIAERLFITEKTASVHVSNLMGKLGVANRGAAAALARELAD